MDTTIAPMPVQEIIAWSLLSGVLGFLLAASLMTQLRYRVSRSSLVISLFGVPIRKIRLTDIVKVSKRKTAWAENWGNCLRRSHRQLVIHRKRGLFRQIVITPKHRYIFRKQLEESL